jgi:cytochrome c-type biogenesis protein
MDLQAADSGSTGVNSMATAILALLAGVLTVAAPCTLPVLPVLLAGSVGRSARARPFFIVAGFVTSFAGAALLLGAVTRAFGISQDIGRPIGVGLLLLFGILLLWPTLYERLWMLVGSHCHFGGLPSRWQKDGNVGGFVLGTTLGLVWTPCAGPVLGSILTVIATSDRSGSAAVLLLVYAIGASVPMLLIAYGGQFVTTRVRWLSRAAAPLQRGFGAIIVLFAAAMYFDYDTFLIAWISDFYPGQGVGL